MRGVALASGVVANGAWFCQVCVCVCVCVCMKGVGVATVHVGK